MKTNINTLYLTYAGSRSYGTALPTSDTDYRGFFCPSKDMLFGFQDQVEQHEEKSPDDKVIYDIRKFFKLAAECNPNILEILFVDKSDIVICNPVVENILANKQEFLSQKIVVTYAGYATSQFKRLESHRAWLRSPPKAPPQRTSFGLSMQPVITHGQLDLIESMIREQVDNWNIDLESVEPIARFELYDKIKKYLATIHAATLEQKSTLALKSLNLSDVNFELIEQERKYRAAIKHWNQYQNWIKTRNVSRAASEEKCGYDTKNAMHLVRLLKMCHEILSTKQMHVKRSDADELLYIRNGHLTYEDLVSWVKTQEEKIALALQTTTLPKSSNKALLNRLCISTIEACLNENGRIVIS